MLITRKTKVPLSWAFFAQLTLILSIYGQFVVNAPFILLIKKYLDNPATIMGLISIQIYITFVGGPLVAWVSDRIWTRFGRRKVFVASADFLKALFLIGMPFAPNLWTLIILRWLYDFFGDLAAPAQAMIWEVVPAKQRGMSAGFLKSFMNVGNLVFFTLLLGRFHDVYFLGPFQFFGTPSGGTLMFIVCVLLFLGAAVFEAIGVKETYPPGRKRLTDGRKPGESMVRLFVRSVFADILSKDLYPLYLLLFANTMFGFSLGVFQPLLFTEQWGYDLQTFGNTIAIGVPLGIILGLLGGWMADRFGKMRIVFWATVGNLVINIAYTAYVYFLPDYRPSFWEIVAFGNIAYIFGGIKSASSGPLLWEYVARNRMGAATAGMGVFNAIFRNSVGVIVGLWLLVWSIWLYPQAGYNVTAFFDRALDRPAVLERAQAAGLDPDTLKLRPLHQPGTDEPTSRRWWIHQEDQQAADWIQEREDLQNRISSLAGKSLSYFTNDAERAEYQAEADAARARIATIETDLTARAQELENRLAATIEPIRFPAGDQLRSATFDGRQLVLETDTIEALPSEQLDLLRNNLQGQEFLTRITPDANGIPRPQPILTVEPLPADELGLNGVRLTAELDPRFVTLFAQARTYGLRTDTAFNLASGILAVATSQFTTSHSDYLIEPPPDPDHPGTLSFILRPTGATAGDEPLSADALKQLFTGFDKTVEVHAVTSLPDGAYRIDLTSKTNNAPAAPAALAFDEIRPRLEQTLGDDPTRVDLTLALYRKLAETLQAPPIYVTVPRSAVQTGYSKRVYEYFFSSQILQIATDVLGIGILMLIIYLEKRGTLHRYGAEEDQNR